MRLPPATRATFPEDLAYVYDRLAAGRELANIFATMGNNPELLRAYTRFGNALWTSCGLDVATRELVILRTAILRESAYEWHQHVRIGREAGLTDDRIRALHDWPASPLFTADERAILAYVDALAASDHPSQEIYDAVASGVPASTVVGITLLTAFYAMTAKFLAAMEVTPETAFIGWHLP